MLATAGRAQLPRKDSYPVADTSLYRPLYRTRAHVQQQQQQTIYRNILISSASFNVSFYKCDMIHVGADS